MEKVANISNNLSAEKRPASVRTILILAFAKILISSIFFIVFTIKGISLGSVGPQIILYTTLGYAAMAVIIYLLVKRKRLWELRAALLVDFAVSLPATAIIGLVFSSISLILTFTKGARNYLK
ncbi:MAG: hypothetical protein AAFY71_02315 [Bacteroidota bacterium]